MSLAKRLQREIKANPAKAGGLGVLLLVAMYFWLPLLRGLIASPEAPAATPPATTPPATASAPVAPSSQPGQPPTSNFDWQKLAGLIDQDPQMRPAGDLPLARDPFSSAAPEPAAQAEKTEALAPKVVAEVTPEEAGLVLSTVLIGARRKIAEIDGKSFSIGDQVPAPSNPSQTFRLVEIYPRRVVLESRGQQYELTIPRPLVDAVAEANAEDDHETRPPAVEQHITGDQGPKKPGAPKSTQ